MEATFRLHLPACSPAQCSTSGLPISPWLRFGVTRSPFCRSVQISALPHRVKIMRSGPSVGFRESAAWDALAEVWGQVHALNFLPMHGGEIVSGATRP